MALTTDELKNIKVGQTVFVKTPYGIKYYPAVEKIGKKYFYTSDRRKWDKATGENISEFLKAYMWISEDAHKVHLTDTELREIFRRKLSSINIHKIPVEEIKKAAEILKIDLDK